MHLMTISEIIHYETDGSELWSEKNLTNTFHTQGQEYILKSLFAQNPITNSYYVGLDNRIAINVADISSGLVGEPNNNGYFRKAISTAGGFGTILNTNWQIKSSTLLFTAVGGGWGPVRNAFLTTSTGNSGFLISSVPLLSARTLTVGQTLSFRFVLSFGG